MLYIPRISNSKYFSCKSANEINGPVQRRKPWDWNVLGLVDAFVIVNLGLEHELQCRHPLNMHAFYVNNYTT